MLLRHLGFLQDLKKPSKFIKNLQKGKNANVLIKIKKTKVAKENWKIVINSKKNEKKSKFRNICLPKYDCIEHQIIWTMQGHTISLPDKL